MDGTQGFASSRSQECFHSRRSYLPTVPGRRINSTPVIRLTSSSKQIERMNRLNQSNTSTQRQMSLVDSLLQSSSILIGLPADNNVEAEIFRDLAHVFLDLATFFSPDTILLRLLLVFGRCFAILSDYIPDQMMMPDEFIFQLSMLGYSSRKFLQKFEVVLHSTSKSSTFRDRRVYHTSFRPAGFTWTQYMALMNDALEWVEAPDGAILFEDKANLLVMSGGLVHTRNHLNDDVEIYRRSGRSSRGIIGDLSMLSRLNTDEEWKDIKRSSSKNSQHDTASNKNAQSIEDARQNDSRMLQAWGTGTGASLLRINTERLFNVAKKDPRIAECTKNLYFSAMQERLQHYEHDSKSTFTGMPNPTFTRPSAEPKFAFETNMTASNANAYYR